MIALIALSLIAFILMDAFQGGGSNLFGSSDAIGKVNGVKIRKADFDKEMEMYKQPGQSSEQMIGQLWDMNVDRVIMQEEYERTGLSFTSKELSSVLFGGTPPQWLQQAFTDPNTGQYNAEQARQFFANQRKQKGSAQTEMIYNAYIKPTIEQTTRAKYISLITNSVYVPKWLAEKNIADNSQIASAAYVYVPYSSLSDSSFKVTDEEVEAYVKKFPAEFRVEQNSRQMMYVPFDIIPTASDSANAQSQVSTLKADFAAAKDEEAFLNRSGSEMPYYNSYFSKSKIQHAFKDSVTSIPVGGIYGPYIDGGNYVMAKLVGVKNWPDSVKVRHILIETANPQTGQVTRDDSTAKRLADSISTAIRNGANFDSLVVKFSDDKGSVAKGGVYDYFPQGQMVTAFNDYAFDGKVGDKGVVKTEFGYHYMEILGQKNFQPAYKIAYLAKPIIASQETINAANDQALKFAGESKDQKSFNANLAKLNRSALQSADIKENDFQIPGLGESRSLIRWVYENDLGDISDPFDLKDKYVVAMVSNIQKKGLMNAAKARPLAEQFIRNQKKAKDIIAKFKGNTLESYAQGTGTQIARVDSLVFGSAPFVPNVGMEPRLVGAAHNKNLKNKASEPIVGATGVFAVRQELVSAVPPTNGNIDMVRQQLTSQQRSSGGFRSAESLKKSATIKDYRFNFY